SESLAMSVLLPTKCRSAIVASNSFMPGPLFVSLLSVQLLRKDFPYNRLARVQRAAIGKASDAFSLQAVTPIRIALIVSEFVRFCTNNHLTAMRKSHLGLKARGFLFAELINICEV